MSPDTPLDSDIHDDSDDARPAGQWLESYWLKAIPWANRLAWLCWLYVGFTITSTLIYLGDKLTEEATNSLIFVASYLLVNAPVIAAGFFLHLFARRLRWALASGGQGALEDGFNQLYRAFLSAGATVAILVLGTLYQAFRML